MELHDIEKMLLDHEKRIGFLEDKKPQQSRIIEKEKGYSGLAGGIRFLIKGGFLNDPKSIPQIEAELKREGYHYSNTGIASTLSETFTKSQKTLNRIKDGKVWLYVIRK